MSKLIHLFPAMMEKICSNDNIKQNFNDFLWQIMQFILLMGLFAYKCSHNKTEIIHVESQNIIYLY